jgi:elongation factor Ts
MSIDTKKVKYLRDLTKASVVECIKALEEGKNDIELSLKILQQNIRKTIQKQNNNEQCEGAEGSVGCIVANEGKSFVVVRLNSMTDFVSKGEVFVGIMKNILLNILQNKEIEGKTPEESLIICKESSDIREILKQATFETRENISLSYVQKLTTTEGKWFFYIHNSCGRFDENSFDGGLGSIISGVEIKFITDIDEEVAKTICLQIVSSNPIYVRKEEIPEKVINETEMAFFSSLKEKIPEGRIQLALKGKMGTFLEEVCLLEQKNIRDESETVSQYLDNIAKIIQKTRVAVIS